MTKQDLKVIVNCNVYLEPKKKKSVEQHVPPCPEMIWYINIGKQIVYLPDFGAVVNN